MRSRALCYFQHKGVDYEKGAVVNLPEADINALAHIGLVTKPEAPNKKDAENPPAVKKNGKS